jgi:ABC-type transporter Mla maintaining outer membrane lipid asymmetry ATPase subunit MlaF
MKQKTVIQIWGKAGSGKTTTIKIIRHELEKKYINVHHTYSLPLPNGEIFEIFTCNGVEIGISSMGDDLNLGLRSHLDHCFANCSIIIAASRVYNNVDSYLRETAKTNDFRIVKATNYRIETVRNIQDEFSQAAALHIVDLIDQIMLGTI